jgi:predicted XRE-type DNA-binding protein
VDDAEEGVSEGFGNVFEALDVPDADLQLLKSTLRIAVRRALEARGLSQREAVAVLGVSQPNLARALAEGPRGATLDMLFRLWLSLGGDVRLVLDGFPGGERTGVVTADVPGLAGPATSPRSVPGTSKVRRFKPAPASDEARA